MWDWNVVIASLPYALGVTTVIFGKHIDKLPEDKAKGIHTLPVVIGETVSRYVVFGMVALQYLSVIYLVIIGFFSPVMLVALLGLRSLPYVSQDLSQPQTQRSARVVFEGSLAFVLCGGGILPKPHIWIGIPVGFDFRGCGSNFGLVLIAFESDENRCQTIWRRFFYLPRTAHKVEGFAI